MPSRHTTALIIDNDCHHSRLNTADVGREDGGAPRNTHYQRPAAFLKLPFRKAPASNSSTLVINGERNGPTQFSTNPSPVWSDQQEPNPNPNETSRKVYSFRPLQRLGLRHTTSYQNAKNDHPIWNHAMAPLDSENANHSTTLAAFPPISTPREAPGTISGTGAASEFDAHATDVWLESVRQQFEESSINIPTIPCPVLFFAFKNLASSEIHVIAHVSIPPTITLKAIFNLVMKSTQSELGTCLATTMSDCLSISFCAILDSLDVRVGFHSRNQQRLDR
ncbi:hypothetical protein BD410DRAFT_807224 [Rickenella mellea]|uniref:Uncharacterized protein n=1 Tax=Rickenella mellea TaxID=50990 RepID=A0A4Y7PR18_9AGAM|nr:hypothetical protein BD410DRAFT_807224 [Rickenella mellea]